MNSVKSRGLGRLTNRQAGQALPLIALMIVVLVAMVGLSVDVGNTFAEEREAVAAGNAASLAGMDVYIKRQTGTTDQTIYQTIIASLKSNGVNAVPAGTTAQDGQLEMQAFYLDAQGRILGPVTNNATSLRQNAAYIQINLGGRVGTYFARVVGRPDLPIAANSYAGTCPPSHGVYPVAIDNGLINGTNFANPGDGNSDGKPDFNWRTLSSGPYKGYTARQVFVSEKNPGGFSWVRWTQSGTSAKALETSLFSPGDLPSGFQEAPWPTGTTLPKPAIYPEKPGTINAGDWVYGTASWKNSNVDSAIGEHKGKGTRLILPMYDVILPDGSNSANNNYRVVNFGVFVVLGSGGSAGNSYLDLAYIGGADKMQTSCSVTPPPPPTTQAPPLVGNVELWPEYTEANQERLPIQYVVVLDVSGSMSANFDGQCNNTGSTIQCTNGPAGAPPVTVDNTGPSYWWSNVKERRIYVAKNALKRLVDLANVKGSASYNAAFPTDQIALVTFTQESTSANAKPFSDAAATVNGYITGAGWKEYQTSGGTNGAAGLLRAARIFESAPRSTVFTAPNGQQKKYDYKRVVVFITDGVSNNFLSRTASNLHGGNSDAGTYPSGSPCRVGKVAENASCQTTAGGGKYNGMDRPITQAVNVSNQDIKNNSAVGAEVFAIALSAIPDTGLRDGIASFTDYFFQASKLETYAGGKTNVDVIMETIGGKVKDPVCVPGANNEWLGSITPAEFKPTNGLKFPDIGRVILTDLATNTVYQAPIRVGTGGKATYRFEGLPRGTYKMEAGVFYVHPVDGVVREYKMIYNNEQTGQSITVTIDPAQTGGFVPEIRQDLKLKLPSTPVCQ